ncbi:protein PALE CRESS, chloroplastic isoform X2 [Rhododendron vialii]|uniref:protein PALE CRESS, chloroplastic isoform X2 n=1 Tax=Rhododendron vialii TaxID=182163 RepID=UPI00265FC4FE|nr:protein PALE CRESS, chloroplastic isoform X2 [Rhododendron vialii]
MGQDDFSLFSFSFAVSSHLVERTVSKAYAPKMVALAFQLTSRVPPPPPATLNSSTLSSTSVALISTSLFKTKSRPTAAAGQTKKTEEQDLHSLPKEFYDDEWQAQQREKTKKLHQQRQVEDEEEERKVDEYREIGMRLKDYPEDDLRQARQLVSSLLKSAEEVEEKIEEAAERGELTELVLMVIWNRLDLARRDDEKDAIRSLDLLYRRIETEILKREAPPAMRLLNDLLILHDGFDEEGWLKECRKRMVETFPREDPYSILVPVGFDIDKHQGPLRPPLEEEDDILLRVDFVREVDALLREVRAEQREAQNAQGLDPESVAIRLKQQEKQQTIRLVEALLDLAIDLKW